MSKRVDPDNLEKLLREWEVKDSVPPRFQEQVWSRIAAAETRSRTPFWVGLLDRLASSFEKPKFALSYGAVVVAIGIAMGTWTAHVKTTHWETDLGQRYLQALNPHQQVASR
jgi:hypothetical protein